MAGIIKQKMGAPEAAPDVVGNVTPEQEEQMPPEQGMEQEEAADPGTQKAYDRVMDAFSISIHSEGQTEAIMQALQTDDPAKMIATLTISILAELDQKSGGKIPSEILIEAAVEGMELIAEIGESAGLYRFDETMQASAMQNLVAIAVERGIIDPAEIEELIASMDPAEVQGIVQQQAAFGQPQAGVA